MYMANPIIRKTDLYLFLLWTVLVGSALGFSLYHERLDSMAAATVEARARLDQDIKLLSLLTRAGGLYVSEHAVPSGISPLASNNYVTTRDGERLTLISSGAVIKLMSGSSGGDFEGWRPDPKAPLLKLINPHQEADVLEQKALAFFRQNGQEFTSVVTLDGEPHLRLTKPFLFEKECVRCHAVQGLKEGELCAVSITIPVKSYLQAEERTRNTLIMANAIVWMFGCAGLVAFARIRKQQARALYDNERKFKIVSDSSHDWGYWITENNEIAYMSPSCEQVTGYPPEAFTGSPSLIEDIIFTDDRPVFDDHLKRDSRDGHRELELRIVTRDGRFKWLSHSCSPLIVDNTYLGRRVNNRDISEYKLVEAALREQKLFAANLIENCAVATFVLDKSHRITLWNKACEELTGYHASEMIGTNEQWKPFYQEQRETLADIIMKGTHQKLPDLYKLYSKSPLIKGGIRAEGRYPDLGGKARYLVMEAAPIYDSKGELSAVIETLQDLTESKKLQEQLLQAQKLDAIGKLAGGVAHDLKNIMCAVVGFSRLTLKTLADNDPARGHVQQVLRAADRAASLTQGLLSFSRRRIVNPQICSLNALVSGFEKFLKQLIREDTEIVLLLSEKEIDVVVDSGQMEQVLMNLVTNARDAMKSGGTITIGIDHFTMNRDFIEAHGYGIAGTYALLHVSDTGEGMDDKTQERIFEPFFTTKEKGKGTGLGLAMVYGIIKQHNGFIEVNSTRNKGTSFKIYIPTAEDKVGVQKDEAPLTASRA